MTAECPVIELTAEEWLRACAVGCARQLRALVNEWTPSTATHGEQLEHGIDWNCRGAVGELVVSRWIGVEWNPVDLSPTDVGPLHVRTRVQPAGALLVRQKDPDDGVFVLVTGVALKHTVRGWALGRDAKREDWKYVKNGQWRGCYYMPQSELRTNLVALRDRTLAMLQSAT